MNMVAFVQWGYILAVNFLKIFYQIFLEESNQTIYFAFQSTFYECFAAAY